MTVNEFLETFETELSEADKIARSFDHTTSLIIQHGEHEIELLRAMGDKEALVKEQIKTETVKHVRNIFNDCFTRTMCRKAWND